MNIPENWREVEPGIWKIKRAVKADESANRDRYIPQLTRALNLDRGHYNRMLCRPGLGFVRDLGPYEHVMAVGGGWPKLESYIRAVRIESCDCIASTYQRHHREFAACFGPLPDVEYRDVDITHSQFEPHADLVTYVHVFEHLPLSAIRRLLRNTRGEILVYGPNIEAAKPGWHHFRDPYHRTMLTQAAMERELRAVGYTIVHSLPHSDDYLIYATPQR